MASSPRQAFTLSELAALTGTGVASTHAILNALVRHGHLVRQPAHKTYRLAPALFAVGQVVREHDPLLASACAAAETLAAETGLEALLTARAGDDIIALSRVAKGPLPRISMRVGERAPLQPPVGTTFLAWADDEEIARWLARGGEDHDEADRQSLALVRQRGFLVMLRSAPQDRLQDALSVAGRPAAIDRARLDAMMTAFYGGIYQPSEIAPEVAYRVTIISAPLFDATGQVAYSLTIGGFDDTLSGAEIDRLAGRLLSVCDDVMRANGIRRG